jgi:hypothetical protein
MTNARRALVAAALLAGGVTGVSCRHSSVLPPTASIPTPRPAPPGGEGDRGFTTGIPALAGNAWRPTVPARAWQYIVVHHTATNSGSVESIHESHLKNKDKNGNPWLGIGYHFVIGNGQGMPDGAVESTFRWRTQIQGAHAGSSNKDYNERGIGVCLIGNFENALPTPAQRRSVKRLIQTLKTEYHIATPNVVGHRDIRATSTECPGKFFPMAEVAADEPPMIFGSLNDELQIDRLASTTGSTLR